MTFCVPSSISSSVSSCISDGSSTGDVGDDLLLLLEGVMGQLSFAL